LRLCLARTTGGGAGEIVLDLLQRFPSSVLMQEAGCEALAELLLGDKRKAEELGEAATG
jgi:hypothetical protein